MVEEKQKTTPLTRRIDGEPKTHDGSDSRGKAHFRQGIGGTLGHQSRSCFPSATTLHAETRATHASRLAADDATGVRGDGRTGPRDEDAGPAARDDGGAGIREPLSNADGPSATSDEREALVPLIRLHQGDYQTDYYAPTSGRALFTRLCDWFAKAVRS